MKPHFHGSPIWGNDGQVAAIAHRGSGAFVSYAWPRQLNLALDHAENVAIDNGAFSAWKSGKHIEWADFYRFLDPIYDRENMRFFVIPDVIDGDEDQNDALIRSLPPAFADKAVPTWHMHESIERFIRLCSEWPRVCIGSSGQYATIRSAAWKERMKEAFTAVGHIKPVIHGLRMLDGRVLGNYPLATADSTNLACNVPKFDHKYREITDAVRAADYARGLNEKELKSVILNTRCAILKASIEKVIPPTWDDWLNSTFC